MENTTDENRPVLDSDLPEVEKLCKAYESSCGEKYRIPYAPYEIQKAGFGKFGWSPAPSWAVVKHILKTCIERGSPITKEEFYEIEHSIVHKKGALY